MFDNVKDVGLVTAINGVCSGLVYCKVLLKGLLILVVMVLGYVLVAVAPASALIPPTTLDIAVVRGTDNGVYWNAYTDNCNFVPCRIGWGSWQSLGGSTLSVPGICEYAGSSPSLAAVVVRGTDNGVYINAWSSSTGWSGWGSPPGGESTIDQPACAYLGSYFYVVVRGTGGELYWNRYNGVVWSGWADLHGASASAPVLVSTPYFGRVDLFVQGTDNGIYHKAYTTLSGAWSSSWDSPGGATSSQPAAALYTEVYACTPGPCIESDSITVLVRGTDNNVYHNYYEISPTPGWGTWYSLYSGQTLSAPKLAYYANGCAPGTQSNCYATDALAVRGTDNKVYHITLALNVFSAWDSPGGSIVNSPALAYVPGTSAEFLLLVEGYPSNNLYSNTVTGTSTWSGFSNVDSGATPSTPALVAIV